ncbi:MAG: hypothetical protein V3W14_05825 [Candidatus Neomarinimicrobiota bacterium]
MNAKKMLQAWLGGFVVMYVISFIWYYFIITGYNEVQFAEVAREEMSMTLITLGYLVLTFLMSYMYPIGYGGGPPLKEGMRFGVLLGLIVSIPTALIFSGAYNMPFAANLVDAIYHTVEITIGAMVMALIYGGEASG